MDVFPKFIIEDDSLILSKVTYHRHLMTDRTKVRGGGWYNYDNDSKTFTFFGKSEEFGKATIDDIKKCIDSGNVYTNKSKMFDKSKDFKFLYATDTEYIELN